MLQSLLVPLDGSKLSEGSLPVAGRLARAAGASVHLAHVHVPYEPDHLLGNTQFQYEGVNVKQYDARQREDEEKYLSDLTNRLERAHFIVCQHHTHQSRVGGDRLTHRVGVHDSMPIAGNHCNPDTMFCEEGGGLCDRRMFERTDD